MTTKIIDIPLPLKPEKKLRNNGSISPKKSHSKKEKNVIKKNKSTGLIKVNKIYQPTISSLLSKSVPIPEIKEPEEPKKELTIDEMIDLEIQSIINGTPDADEYFTIVGDVNVVDVDKFYQPYKYYKK